MRIVSYDPRAAGSPMYRFYQALAKAHYIEPYFRFFPGYSEDDGWFSESDASTTDYMVTKRGRIVGMASIWDPGAHSLDEVVAVMRQYGVYEDAAEHITPDQPHVARVLRMAVDKDFREQGVHGVLMKQILKHFRQAGTEYAFGIVAKPRHALYGDNVPEFYSGDRIMSWKEYLERLTRLHNRHFGWRTIHKQREIDGIPCTVVGGKVDRQNLPHMWE